MDFLGIGFLEILMILVIALIVLGPARTMGLAREAGKVFSEMRRAMSELSQAVDAEELDASGPDTDRLPDSKPVDHKEEQP